MITYTIESQNKQLFGYAFRLSDAKEIAKKMPYALITKLQGPYKYEGMHQYYLEYKEGKFKYIWKRK